MPTHTGDQSPVAVHHLTKAVSVATAANVAGRLANVAIPVAVITACGATADTDRFFFVLAVGFYFYGVIANAVTQAATPLLVNGRMAMDRRTVGLTAFAAASAVLAVSWAANTWTVQVHAVYPAALSLMAGSGLANGMAAGQWHARDRFAIPGMTWSLRLLPLVIWWVRGAGPHDLPLLALGIGMADGLRCAILLRGVDSRQPDIRAVALPVRAICRTYGIVVLTALIGGVNPIIDRMIATLSGPGGVSVLEAGERIYMVLAGVSTMGIGMVLLTRLSRFAADGTLSHHWPALLRFLGQWIGLWTAVGALAGFLGLRWWLESAAAMDPGQNHAAVAVYGWYLAGLPFFALAMAYVRRLQAQQRWWIMVLTSSVTVALNIPLSLILRQQMGVPGIALATTIIHGVNCMILMAAAHCHRETS